ncbi:MAG: hypothetical protein JKY33_07145 [Bacteroidia bacterium]|nr:hypothetical protein [Bacteroidia bacterium]
MSYYGDVRARNIGDPNSNRYAMNFMLDFPISKAMSFSISILNGKIAGNEISAPYRNFESHLKSASFLIKYHLSKNRSDKIKVHVLLGANTLLWKTYADIMDFNGNQYYYWTNGSVNDLAEDDPDVNKALPLKRDYIYETEIASSQFGVAIPLGMGVEVQLTQKLDLLFSTTYNYSFSDNLDNLKLNGNDHFAYTSIGFKYQVTNIEEELDEFIPELKDDTLYVIDMQDSDKDGVKDFDDKCPNTAIGVAVNSRGCPADNDKDGIPNHLDEEDRTKKKVMVDLQGKEITEGVGIAMLDYTARIDSGTITAIGDTTTKKPEPVAEAETTSEPITITAEVIAEDTIPETTIIATETDISQDDTTLAIQAADTLTKTEITITTIADTSITTVSSIDQEDEVNEAEIEEIQQIEQEIVVEEQASDTTKRETEVTPDSSVTILEETTDTASTSAIAIEEVVEEVEAEIEDIVEPVPEEETTLVIDEPVEETTTESFESTVLEEESVVAEEIETELPEETETDVKVEVQEPVSETKTIESQKSTPEVIPAPEETTVATNEVIQEQLEDTLILGDLEEEPIQAETTEIEESKEETVEEQLEEKQLSGPFYAINIGAFRNSIPDRFFEKLRIKDVFTEKGEGESTYYIVGHFKSLKDAGILRKDLKYIGFKDSEVVAYNNGKQISLKEAKEIVE